MMFSLLIIFSQSVHLGIDFGSQFTKTVLAGSMDIPDISINYESKRFTPTFIGFRASPSFDINSNDPISFEDGKLLNPTFGNNAIEIMTLRPWFGTGFLPLFFGLNEAESRRIAKDLFLNTTAARLSFMELSTIFFKLYIDCVSHGKPVNSVTVVVPATFTVPQRREIETAIRGAGFKYLASIDDVDAICHSYSLEKTNKFSSQPRTVLFIDVGAATIKAYCATFEIQKHENGKTGKAISTRLSYSIIKEQGGAYLTRDLVTFIKSKYELEKERVCSDAENRRLFNAAEKLKIQLTLLKTATIIVENVVGDDREIVITRDELDSISENLIKSIIEVSRNASNGIEFDDIEVIGGSSRVPIVLSSIQNEFNVSFIGHSLNADEAIAMGAGYYAQFRSGVSRYQQIQINSPSSIYNISLKITRNEKPKQDSDNGEDSQNQETIEDSEFQICEHYGSCLDNITINESINKLELVYQDSDPHLKTNTFGYKVEMKPNSTILIRFDHNPTDAVSGRVCFNRSFYNYVPLIPLIPIFAASPSYIAVINAQQQRERLGKIRNDLEHFTLRVIDELENNQSVQAFINDEQRFKISSIAERTRKWILEDADSITDEKNFTTKFNHIRDAIMPVYIRMHENKTLMTNIQVMKTAIQLAKFHSLLEWPINKTYINKTEIENFTKLLNETEEWFIKTLNETIDTPLWMDQKVKARDFEIRSKKLTQELIRISKIPPPPKTSIMSTMANKTSNWFKRISKSGIVNKFKNFFKNRPLPKETAKKSTKDGSKQSQKATPKPDLKKDVQKDAQKDMEKDVEKNQANAQETPAPQFEQQKQQPNSDL
ncbi:hypothetical protein TRFO_35731 [Tritrichomonas foetus]|uniref:DnaK protein n=1 Tax=Tritrichomonas foetus TaxID=1144522 RepID=A0A1J4JFP4_9EUKA|nr:hypothetical protein TRFO_35731 [Tritrichomonas foetus]|eukprot:OHS97936.1 hypothetical protein TRFO_35731 [Tritrichomonas foetus]